MIRKNKGEWSELYALFRLLDQGKIYAADNKLKKIDDIYFPIIKIIREESIKKIVDYTIDENNKTIKIFLNNSHIKDIPMETFRIEADELLKNIKIGGQRAFEIESTENFMQKIYCEKVTAKSSDKTDITMQIKDVQTGYSPVCGFSIKSELGMPPTLLNASRATNFIYKIDGLNKNDVKKINEITTGNKIQKRMEYLFECADVEFLETENVITNENLLLLDSKLPDILAEALLVHFRDGISKCTDIIGKLEYDNPLGFPDGGYYEFKFKKFLCAVALGMKPSVRWNGRDEANGGYIVITKDGDVLAYHIYNRNYFEDYLLYNTKFEKASTTRHGYASVYNEENEYRIKLNLQIRFI